MKGFSYECKCFRLRSEWSSLVHILKLKFSISVYTSESSALHIAGFVSVCSNLELTIIVRLTFVKSWAICSSSHASKYFITNTPLEWLQRNTNISNWSTKLIYKGKRVCVFLLQSVMIGNYFPFTQVNWFFKFKSFLTEESMHDCMSST